jgi:hypothetical protein
VRIFDWELDGLRHHLERAIKADGPNAQVKLEASATLSAVTELLERRAADRKFFEAQGKASEVPR